MRETWPVVQRQRGKLHAVIAAGAPADGSLYGMFTFCDQEIRDLATWQEVPGAEPECALCLRRLARGLPS